MSVTITSAKTKAEPFPEKVVIPPKITCGFLKWRKTIASMLIFLTVVYFSLCYILDTSEFHYTTAPEFCTPDASLPCTRSDLFAFQIGSGIFIVYCGMTGLITWHVSKRAHTAIPSTAEGRMFGYLDESDKLAAANFTFQVWDFLISLRIPEHATAIMLCHHALAALVSWCSMRYQYLHYYGVFFLGVTEISSIFLVLIDLARFFPPSPSCPFSILVAICQPAFVVSFFYYRIIVWWKVSALLWTDAFHVLNTGAAERYRPGKSFVLYLFLVSNVVLGILQVYWFGFMILPECLKFFG